MKQAKKHISLLLALLLTLNLLPAGLLAEAAEGAYTVLCEPNMRGGVVDETYGNVAILEVSQQVYQLVEYTNGGVRTFGDTYVEVSGFVDSGYARVSDKSWAQKIINYKGETLLEQTSGNNGLGYEIIYQVSDDGYVVTRYDGLPAIVDLNSGNTFNCTDMGFYYNNGRMVTRDDNYSASYVDDTSATIIPGPFVDAGNFRNGYAIVRPDSWDQEQIIDTNGTPVLADATLSGTVRTYGDVSAEDLVRVQSQQTYSFGYMDLTGNITIPCEYGYDSRDFHNGYAVVQGNGGMGLIDTKGSVIVPFGTYGNLSNVSDTGIVWATNYTYETDEWGIEKAVPTLAAVLQVDVSGGSSAGEPSTPTVEPEEEYIYNVPDPGEDLELPVEILEQITCPGTAADAVTYLTNMMTDEQKTAPTGIDLATLFAETAASKAASKAVGGGDILIDAAMLADVAALSGEAKAAVSESLAAGGVEAARSIPGTVVLTTKETAVTVRISPDVLSAGVDKVRVETPAFALTFKLSDLAPDLTQVLTFSAGAVDGDARTRAGSGMEVAVELPEGGTTNSVTVSMPSGDGDKTYQAMVSQEEGATASKYNPATTKIDGKVNKSGTYAVQTNERDFTDIANKSAEMQKAIRYLASKGIINGRTATTFEPDGRITRAEIANLLVKALGKLDSKAVPSFSDVKSSDWFYTAAGSSQKHGLIGGEEGKFQGNKDIIKEQIVVVASRVLTTEMNYKAPSNVSSLLSRYSDGVADWAQKEVSLAVRENLVLNRTDGTFSGSKEMTRGDAAIIIYRLFQKIW